MSTPSSPTRNDLLAAIMREGNDRPTAAIILDAREAAAARATAASARSTIACLEDELAHTAGGFPMRESASVCIDDARFLARRSEWANAESRARKGLQYLVGFRVDETLAAHAAQVALDDHLSTQYDADEAWRA